MIVQTERGINPNVERKEVAVKRARIFLGAAFVLFVCLRLAGAEKPQTLDIYFLDMVGGASTLIVTPLGESVLIDTGSLRPQHRPASHLWPIPVLRRR